MGYLLINMYQHPHLDAGLFGFPGLLFYFISLWLSCFIEEPLSIGVSLSLSMTNLVTRSNASDTFLPLYAETSMY